MTTRYTQYNVTLNAKSRFIQVLPSVFPLLIGLKIECLLPNQEKVGGGGG